MGLLKASVIFKSFTDLPEDQTVNTFYFSSGTIVDPDAPSVTEIDDVRDRLIGFYNDTRSTTFSLAHYLSEQVIRGSNQHSIDFYWNVDDEIPPTWGSPYAVRSWTLDPAGSSTSMPAEVAAVLSFHGDLDDIPETAPNPSPPPATIRPASRRRGRIYFGPLQTNSGDESATTKDFVPSTAFRTTLAESGDALATASDPDWQWVVASGAASETYQVEGGWVDNAYDTQRRRGREASARTTWSV